MQAQPPIVITVYLSKGGVGKTTITALIAQFLAGIGLRAVIIDADRQGSMTTLMQLERGEALHHVLKREMHIVEALAPVDSRLIPAFRGQPQGSLSVVRGGPFSKIAIDKGSQSPDKYGMRDSLDLFVEPIADLTGYADVVLIDMGPSDQKAAIAALIATDYVLIPTACEWLSLDRIQSVLIEVALVRQRKNIEVIGIIPNMAEYHFGRLRKSKTLQSTIDYLENRYPDYLLRDEKGIIDLPLDEDWKTGVWVGDLLFSDATKRQTLADAMRFLNAVARKLGLEEYHYVR